MRILTAVCLLALSAAPAFAGQAEAQSCASSLDANGQAIFNAVLPQVTPTVDLKAAVTTATKAMVESGQLTMSKARPAAMAAGECLKLAMQ
jgi:azurin